MTTWNEAIEARQATMTATERARYDRRLEEERFVLRLGELVRARRERVGLSQSELARRMGTGQPTIARLEAGGVSPNIATIARVARALGLTLEVDLRPPDQRTDAPSCSLPERDVTAARISPKKAAAKKAAAKNVAAKNVRRHGSVTTGAPPRTGTGEGLDAKPLIPSSARPVNSAVGAV